MTLRTWHVESAVVLAALSLTALVAGGAPLQWLGVLAVWLSFGHAQIADRMAEREAARPVPSVHCYRKATAFYVGKELAWVTLFLASHAYAAVVGSILFLAYPAWRRLWRRLHPITARVPMTEAQIEALAQHAYDRYGATTDHKNYQGLPMPAWEALPPKIQQAWRNAATAAREFALPATPAPVLPEVGKATDEQLAYAATSRCSCGAGIAHLKNCGPHGQWDCSAILTGRAIPAGQPGAEKHTAEMPFTFYEIKSENQPSAGGATTRPSTADVPEAAT